MRIVKRKRDNKRYFYLQHSFRENGKAITRELYLGESIPDDIEERKTSLREEALQGTYTALEEIRKLFQAEWKTLPAPVREKEKEEIAIAFTYNTNAIEGSTITLPETREILQEHIAPNKPMDDVKETEAHAKVFLEMLTKEEELTEKLMLAWHTALFRETKPELAGKYREYLVRISQYKAPDWQEVPKMMKELNAFLQKSETNPVELAARSHYRFEKIHPFGDGNGRTGRLLMNHILWWAGYPMLIIEKKKRKAYYRALENDEERFVQYFFRLYLRVHGKKKKASEK